MTIDKEIIADWFKLLQNDICRQLEQEDGAGKFKEDLWERPGGGGGKTRIMKDGQIIEKGGVNFSAVYGKMPEKISDALQLENGEFFATGVSIVIHPHNPYIPIIHMNVRYFETLSSSSSKWWFGGGIDLTPHYVNPAEAGYFHKQLKSVCDQHDQDFYPEFKKWADDYFYIRHREETRGIGGVFFDHLNGERNKSKEELFEFVKDLANAFAPTYRRFMKENRRKAFTEKEKQWQYLRRGRYVEFNLVYDRGTKFGLDTSGRTESILMSLPSTASWEYNHHPKKGSKEEETLKYLKKGINWLDHD